MSKLLTKRSMRIFIIWLLCYRRLRHLHLQCSLELSKRHRQIRTLREKLPPFGNVRLQKRLLLMVRQHPLLCLLYEFQNVLKRGTLLLAKYKQKSNHRYAVVVKWPSFLFLIKNTILSAQCKKMKNRQICLFLLQKLKSIQYLLK